MGPGGNRSVRSLLWGRHSASHLHGQAVDLYALAGGDQQVLPAVNDTGLH